MRHESANIPRSNGARRLAAASRLALAVLLLLSGCTLQLRTNDNATVGEALSNLGQASENTWNDFTSWFDQRF